MARKIITLETTVYRVEQIKSSPSGNPAFRFYTADGQFRTVVDTMCAYEVTNNFQPNSALNNGNGVAAKLTMTPAQRIYGCEVIAVTPMFNHEENIKLAREAVIYFQGQYDAKPNETTLSRLNSAKRTLEVVTK